MQFIHIKQGWKLQFILLKDKSYTRFVKLLFIYQIIY